MVDLVTHAWKSRRLRNVMFAAIMGKQPMILLWKIPVWQAADIVNTTENPNARAILENEYRRTMATILGGSILITSGVLSWFYTSVDRHHLMIAIQGQITDRFTKAIEQLGATYADGRLNIEIRLGGIYALERIAQDSLDKDHESIMEVLTAYVRGYDRKQSAATESERELKAVRADVQAILTVLGRRTEVQRRYERKPLDLSRSDLRGARLNGARLAWTSFVGARLDGVDFSGADLAEVDFRAAHLEGANLKRVFSMEH